MRGGQRIDYVPSDKDYNEKIHGCGSSIDPKEYARLKRQGKLPPKAMAKTCPHPRKK